jgi:hypothetical protein
MASMNGVGRVLCVVALASVPAMSVGCGNPPPSRPDAYVSTMTDAYVPGMTDTGMVVTMSDAGRDAGGTRVCRSPMGECDLLAQDCAMGEACVYALPDAMATTPQTVCAPIVGAGAEEGGACCALNSCDAGLVCVGAVETMPGTCTSMGTCQRYCCGSSSDCSPGDVCSGFGSSFMGGICDQVDGCSLVAQTGCEGMAGTGCYPSAGGATQCVTPTAAMAAEGATCMYTNDCVPGTACFTVTPGGGGMARSICLRFCDIDDGAADCPNPMGMACQTGGELPAGTGICPPPA